MKIISPKYWLFLPILAIIFWLTKLLLSVKTPDEGSFIALNIYGGAIIIAFSFIGSDIVLSKIHESKLSSLRAAKIGGLVGVMSFVIGIGFLGILSDHGFFKEIMVALGSGLIMLIWRIVLLIYSQYFILRYDRLAFGMTFIIGIFGGIVGLSYLKSFSHVSLVVSILLHFLELLPVFIGLFYCSIILSELKKHRTRINFLIAILLFGLSMDLFYENYPF